MAQQHTGTERFNQALEHFNQKEYQKTLEILDEISGLICDEPYMQQCTHSEIIRANIYRNLSEFDKAREALDRAFRQFDQYHHEENPLLIRLKAEHGYLLHRLGDLEPMEQIASDLLGLVHTHSFTGIPRSVAYIFSGRVQALLGDFEQSVEEYQTAITSLEGRERTIEVVNLLSQAYNNIGISYRRLGNNRLALQYFQNNLEIIVEAFGDNHSELGYVYNSIGTIYYTIGDYGTAGDYFRRSAVIFGSALGEDNPGYAAALNNAGASYMQFGDYEASAEMIERAQQIRINTLGHHHYETAVGYSNLANIYTRNEDYEQARINYERSVEVRETVHGINHPSLISPLIQLGKLYKKTGNSPEARVQLNRAERIVLDRFGTVHPDIWEIHRIKGQTYLEEQNFSRAEEYFLKAYNSMIDESGISFIGEADYSLISHPIHFMNVINQLGNLYLQKFQQGEPFVVLYDAFRYFRYASDIVDFLQIRFQNEASKLSLIDQNYSIYTNAIRTAYFLLNETGDNRWLDEILFISEKSRARIALELLQNLDARNFAGIPDEVIEEEQNLNAEITRLYNQLHNEQDKGTEADQELITATRDTLFLLKRDHENFTRQLEENYPVYFDLKYQRELADKGAIHGMLGGDKALLSYIVADDFLMVLVFEGDNGIVEKIPIEQELSEKITGLRESVIDGNREMLADFGHRLYQTLFEPVREHISAQSIIIIPDQALHYLPFDLLITENTPSSQYHELPFLLHEKRVMYAPSITMLQRMQQARPRNPRNLLALAPFSRANPATQGEVLTRRDMGDLSPLPLTRFETQEIAGIFTRRSGFTDLFNRHSTSLLFDEEATISRFTESLNDPYSYIHLATHAFVNEDNPDRSGIAFYGDGTREILYVSDIYNLRLNADLVVLGACETGMGRAVKGEGLIGFTRAFMYAGASNLVVSMWRVSDQPTSRLMIRFYELVRQGYTYHEALQAAKVELASHPEYSSPLNWAAFVLHGM